MTKRFRSNTIVSWPHQGGKVYGVVRELRRTHCSVFALYGEPPGKYVGVLWVVAPHHMTRVPAGKARDAALVAMARYALGVAK